MIEHHLLLADTATLKLMHSPSEDLVAFQHACGVVPSPMFDTQAAAALAGLGAGLGYQKLVQSVTGVELADGEQIAMNRNETPTRGRALTVLEQLLGNVGRGQLPRTDEDAPGQRRPD